MDSLPEQLELKLEWAEPWEGRSPRSLTRGYCVVDNSSVKCKSGDANGSFVQVDPAQLTAFLKGTPYGSR